MIVEEISTDKLIPYIRNPRNNKGAVAKVAASIKEFGFRQPIVVDHEMVVVAGHTRLAAAWQLGIGKVPVHIAENLSEAQIQAYRIMDNRSHEDAEWDDDLLGIELADLNDQDFDLDLTGFTASEIEQLLNDKFLAGELDGEDDVPEAPAEPKSKRGEIYQLGEHRLMCGDSTSEKDVALLMDGQKADMVFTDPPYGMNLDTDFSGMKGIGQGKKYKAVEGDSHDYDPAHIFEHFGKCKEIFLWGADYYSERIPDRNVGSWIVWDKMDGGKGCNDNYDKMFGSNFELCWSKARHKRALARVLWKGIFGLSKEDTKKRVHPTQKPVELVEWFLTKYGDGSVVDLFGGSGSTMIACEKLNRKCYMMELDPNYCDVIIERYEKLFEKKAEKING